MGLLGKKLQHNPQKRHDFILYLIMGRLVEHTDRLTGVKVRGCK